MATNVPTSPQNHPSTCPSAPPSVWAPQVKDSPSRLPLSAPGPDALKPSGCKKNEEGARARREDGSGKTSNTPNNDGSVDEHEETADGNRGDGWFFDLFLPPQVVGHPFIRGWFLRNLPVHVPSGRLLKEHHVALLSLTTRGPY